MIRYLKSQNEYLDARKRLENRQLSFLDQKHSPIMRSLRTPSVGDILKSWDLELALNEIQKHLPVNAHIADFGAYGSEIPWCLQKLNYKNIYGIDLNIEILKYPKSRIHWAVENYYQSHFKDNSLDCITAISVIEHGYDPEKLLKEVHRVLKPYGKFIFSFDFWPEKLDTSKYSIFDLTWTIISYEEFQKFQSLGKNLGFKLLSQEEEPLPKMPVISYNEKHYTFAFAIIEKMP